MYPLKIYDLESGVGAQELYVIGSQLDEVFEALEELETECFPALAEDYGLKNFEEILPYRPAYITVQDARCAIMALLRIRNGYFSLSSLQDTLSGCGINATVNESLEPMTAVVSFPNNRGCPEGFDSLRLRVEQILPCHIEVKYFFIYAQWHELMARFGTWGALQSEAISWGELEKYDPQNQ